MAIEEKAGSSQFEIEFVNQNRKIIAKSDETVLNAAIRAGIPLRYSCQEGICGTCKIMKLSGEVIMNHQGGIRKRDLDQGFILACCSLPKSDLILR